ncbi:GntR family transcriptional regulator [Gellertiella hungarica]|uniref:DNA-binding GntR family transcriptional regulator n=1 Tax=Gellertiella hungarica TaxID=1572859 RepID=A0A7W6NLL7_9HYPH|nr:GntR family transcriptional regulator [Gellertiella hungarica]MBB4066068.1 DNA-binding GntR family transcriptional regulator [Gellertiella hungarica]
MDIFDAERPALSWTPVYIDLRDAIVSHKIPPGMKLPEDELASIYGVSRTLVRAALQALSHNRLVNLEPNRGAFVAQPSKREAREVFEARALIEPHVAALACGYTNPDQIALLRQHLEREHEAIHAGRDSDAIMLSARFHVGIAEMADHTILTDVVKDLILRSSLIIALYWRRRDTTCERHAHLALVNAIESRNRTDAAELMKSHIVDLLSGLDLSQAAGAGTKSLSAILKGA